MSEVILNKFAPREWPQEPSSTLIARAAAPLHESVAAPVAHSGTHDPLFKAAQQVVEQTKLVSVSHLQTQLRVGYRRTTWMIKAMELAERAAMPSRNTRRMVPASQVLDGYPTSPLHPGSLLEPVPGPADAAGNAPASRRSPQWWLNPADVDHGCSLLELHNALERDLITYLAPKDWATAQSWHADPLLQTRQSIQLAPLRPQHVNKVQSVILEWFRLEEEFLQQVSDTRAGLMTAPVFYRWFASLRNELLRCGHVRSQGRVLLERMLELSEGMVTHIDCVRDAVVLLPELLQPAAGEQSKRLARSLRRGIAPRFGLSVATVWYLELMCSQPMRRAGADFQRVYGYTDALWSEAMQRAIDTKAFDFPINQP